MLCIAQGYIWYGNGSFQYCSIISVLFCSCTVTGTVPSVFKDYFLRMTEKYQQIPIKDIHGVLPIPINVECRTYFFPGHD